MHNVFRTVLVLRMSFFHCVPPLLTSHSAHAYFYMELMTVRHPLPKSQSLPASPAQFFCNSLGSWSGQEITNLNRHSACGAIWI